VRRWPKTSATLCAGSSPASLRPYCPIPPYGYRSEGCAQKRVHGVRLTFRGDVRLNGGGSDEEECWVSAKVPIVVTAMTRATVAEVIAAGAQGDRRWRLVTVRVMRRGSACPTRHTPGMFRACSPSAVRFGFATRFIVSLRNPSRLCDNEDVRRA